MKDKIIEAVKYVRNKKKTKKATSNQRKNFQFHHKTNTSIDQGHFIETFESMKANGVISNKPKGKRGSYFVANRNTIHGSSVINHQQK